MKKQFLFPLIAVLFTVNCNAQVIFQDTISVNTNQVPAKEKLSLVDDGPVKNVIFIIGDGTGIAQIFSGQMNLVGPDGLLHVQTLPVAGFVKTHSADNYITDSASGATAYSCGVKTDNGVIGQLPDGRSCKTILEMAEERGLSTGLIATSTVTHATPASYAAHVPSRRMETEIAAQYLASGTDVILGGGTEIFLPTGDGGNREDGRNLVEEFETEGYAYASNASELAVADGDKILGLFSPGGMPSEERTPTLQEMSAKAIEVLSENEEGFFLMIEGSQIDWAGHANDADYAIREVADYDAAIQTVLEFAQEDGETLVVITADHETGGMTINGSGGEDELTIAWTTGGHTGIPIPIAAYGPHAIQFSGWLDNTEVGIKVAEITGWGTLPAINE